MKKKVIIVTQTGSDLPLDEAASLGILIIPDIVRFGTVEFEDRVNLSAVDFYSRMAESSELPTSSHSSVGAYVKAYRQAKEMGAEEIICMTVTSRMSGSYDTALAAAKTFGRRNTEISVTVYDSEQCSHGMALQLRRAARLVSEGLDSAAIIEELDRFKENIGFCFMLDSLKNARKGGRVGAIKALAADTMGIKPLLHFSHGVCEDYGIAVDSRSGMRKLAERFAGEVDPEYTATLFHAGSPEKAGMLRAEIDKLGVRVKITEAYVGPVIGIYCGEGAVGLAYIKKAEKR